MLTFIGGTPRSGKSTFVESLDHPGTRMDLDHLRYSLSTLLKLDESLELNTQNMSPSETLAWHAEMDDREDKVWEIAQKYANAIGYQGEEGVLYGIIRPEQLITINYPHTAVFFGNLSATAHEHNIMIARTGTKNNWQTGWDDQQIIGWSKLNRERSMRIADGCEKYDYKFFDTSVGFTIAQVEALKLFNTIR